jgi:hypothetical protein
VETMQSLTTRPHCPRLLLRPQCMSHLTPALAPRATLAMASIASRIPTAAIISITRAGSILIHTDKTQNASSGKSAARLRSALIRTNSATSTTETRWSRALMAPTATMVIALMAPTAPMAAVYASLVSPHLTTVSSSRTRQPRHRPPDLLLRRPPNGSMCTMRMRATTRTAARRPTT